MDLDFCIGHYDYLIAQFIASDCNNISIVCDEHYIYISFSDARTNKRHKFIIPERVIFECGGINSIIERIRYFD